MSYWLHPDAETELGDAAVYYAEHANRAVAEAFLAEFERVRDLLVENQQRGPRGEHGLRLYHFDRFPYTVIYEPDEYAGPQIYAIAHQHREPGYWTTRM
ncbi:MAG: type II toxin-antitoxin system RelE/ParE family toxin [Burkholderiaceae bacterium]|nr:type II toxin-antitoxin system RelE/ParE family toxin [Burkholderiaceae bacterium]